MILAELNTHRLFTRNSASSRAIPFKKMVEMVETDPFIPIAWQKDHIGMQGNEYFTGWRAKIIELAWRTAAAAAVVSAKKLHKLGLTKQLANRLLEPFMWHTVLVTATEFENFFNLRCPQYNYGREYFKSKKDFIKAFTSIHGFDSDIKLINSTTDLEWLKTNKGQAEVHMMELAACIWDALNEHKPEKLEAGEWHIPFGNTFDGDKLLDLALQLDLNPKNFETYQTLRIKIAVARCARLSYMTFDGEIDYMKDIQLYDRLLQSGHMSPFEHVARAMSSNEYSSFVKGRKLTNNSFHPNDKGWCYNLRGFINQRYIISENYDI